MPTVHTVSPQVVVAPVLNPDIGGASGTVNGTGNTFGTYRTRVTTSNPIRLDKVAAYLGAAYGDSFTCRVTQVSTATVMGTAALASVVTGPDIFTFASPSYLDAGDYYIDIIRDNNAVFSYGSIYPLPTPAFDGVLSAISSFYTAGDTSLQPDGGHQGLRLGGVVYTPATGTGAWSLATDPPGSNMYVSPDHMTLKSSAASPYFTTVVGYGYEGDVGSGFSGRYFFDVVSNTLYGRDFLGNYPPTSKALLVPGAFRFYHHSRNFSVSQSAGNYFGLAGFIAPASGGGPGGSYSVGTALPFQGYWVADDVHYTVSADGQTITDRGATTLFTEFAPDKGRTSAATFGITQTGTDQSGGGGYQFLLQNASQSGSTPTDSQLHNASGTYNITGTLASGVARLILQNGFGAQVAHFELR